MAAVQDRGAQCRPGGAEAGQDRGHQPFADGEDAQCEVLDAGGLGGMAGLRLAAGALEGLTDDLAARPYQSLKPDELDELMATLEPLATLLLAARD